MFVILIMGLIAGPGGVLVGIADGVARDRRGVRVGALAAVRAVLDQLLGVVPRAAAGGHRDGQEEAGHDRADEQAAEHLVRDQADDDRDHDRDQRRDPHLLERALRDDVDALRVLGPRGALHDPRDLAELAAHLLHDLGAGAADGLHRERGEQVRHDPADQEPDEHPRVRDRERDVDRLARVRGLRDQLVRVGVEEHQRGEAGRADRVALGDGLRGVADRVERIGDAAHRLGHVRHLGDAARVVGDRPEGVERDDHAGQREHRDGRQRDAGDVAELVGDEDADADHEHRRRRGLHRLREARDDVRRVAGRRGLRDALDRPPARARVVLGDHHQRAP